MFQYFKICVYLKAKTFVVDEYDLFCTFSTMGRFYTKIPIVKSCTFDIVDITIIDRGDRYWLVIK